MQWHGHCLLEQYLLTKWTNLGRSVASADTNTVLPARQQVSCHLGTSFSLEKKVPTGKECEGVGSAGVVVVQLLPVAHT